MSFLDAFKRRKPVDISREEMDIKTLDQALSRIETLNTQIQGLETTISERDTRIAELHGDLKTAIDSLGLSKSIDETGIVHWESTSLAALKESLNTMTGERDQLQNHLKTASTRIAELEQDQRTVSARAREFLAAQGGKPLPVSGQGAPKPTNKQQLMDAMDEARRAGNQEEVARLYKEYKALK
jgi:chromosome segregation ATPase